MKNPIAIISTDKHLQEENAMELLDLAEQEIELAKDLGVKYVIWLGDIFDSRLSQRQDILTTLTAMISLYHEENIQVLCIPGNHDKTDYESTDSFLIPFKHHPGFKLIEDPFKCVLFGIEMDFVPFFSQDVWLKKFSFLSTPVSRKSILFSHTAVQGSINNDGKAVSNKISLSLFSKYGKVFLGHYHNSQHPGANVYHLPSTRQNNFGEDEEKGFTVLYDDLSFNLVKSSFVPFKEIKVDVSVVTKDELLKLSKTDTNEANIRITLIGNQQEVKSINKKWFTDNGLSVKTKFTDIEVTEDEEKATVSELSGSDILQKFESFCSEKGYNYYEGLILLKQLTECQE